MAFLLAQGSSTLYKVDLSTGTATALTLPTGVTLSTTRKPKFALLNRWVVMVNSPTKNLVIDPEGTVTPLTPQAPAHGPTMAAGSGTGLTGAYLYRVSFIVKNSDGDLLAESPLSPPSASITLANQNASLTDIAVSPDSHVTGRRIYRTTSGSTTAYFAIMDIEDNTTTALIENVADATLSQLAAITTITSPPGTMPGIRVKNIVEWKSRLWMVADDPSLVDQVKISDTNKVYTFPNTLVMHPTGQDSKGVLAFARRRNQLGFLKRIGVWMVSAASGSTGVSVSNLNVSQIAWERGGCIAEDSVVTIGDNVYWLGRDGIYEWSDNGIINISDAQVAPWFKTDTYFNRTRFQNAFGRYNEITNSYELHVAAAGSSNEDRWVSYNLTLKRFFGPHKTGAFTPSHAGYLVDANGLPVTLVGGTDGVIYTGNSANKRDGSATAIDMDCYGPWHVGDSPDRTHTWLQLSVMSRVEAAGTMDVTPIFGVNVTSATSGTTMTHTLTTGRELLSRIGVGNIARLRFRKNTVNQSAAIYGYELPWFTNGRR